MNELSVRRTLVVLLLLAALALDSWTWGSRCPVAAAPPDVGTGLPRVFCLDARTLIRARAQAAAGDPVVQPALHLLIQQADRALKSPLYSVMEKDRTPPSGDKHDYMSIGPYWWPDPASKNGLPYIRKDGQRNPESSGKGSDAPEFGRMGSAVDTLALAYYLTGKEDYADHAGALLRAWFLDPATRMNPNLNFGQAIPGRVTGRGTGIIETDRLTSIVDSVGLLASSRHWTPVDDRGMREWMKGYLQWLQESPNGRAERAAKNNHGSWYDAQVMDLALYVGQDALARRVAQESKARRIAVQIEPAGRQPLELARTKSFSYSTFNLEALFKLAALADRVGVDLWHYQTADGRSLRKALEFLLPFADPEKPWPYKQIARRNRESLLPLMRQASLIYGGSEYLKAMTKFPVETVQSDRSLLTIGTADLQLPGGVAKLP